jgi:hypothetical protein
MPAWSDAARQDESRHAVPPKNGSTMTVRWAPPCARPYQLARNNLQKSELARRTIAEKCGLHGLGPECPLSSQAGVACQMEETMDDLKKKGTADRSKINVHEVWEVEYWTRELGVSKAELQRVSR